MHSSWHSAKLLTRIFIRALKKLDCEFQPVMADE